MWVGVSEVVTGGHRVVPIKWDPTSNMYLLGRTIDVPYVKDTGSLIFPLKMGPVLTHHDVDDDFYDKFMVTNYKINEDLDLTDEQVEGEDPVLEVEGIRARKGKGNKLKYLVKWVGSDTCTWEPSRHMTKYGASAMIKEFNLSQKRPKVKAH